jgi:hypothetical protein
VDLMNRRYDSEELRAVMPPLPEGKPKTAYRSPTPHGVMQDVDLSRLSPRIRDLILHGNRREYLSRSEADLSLRCHGSRRMIAGPSRRCGTTSTDAVLPSSVPYSRL